MRVAVAMLLAMGLPTALPISAPAQAAQPLVIGVDHADPANQIDHGFGSPIPGRVFEYTDFFSRSVRIHEGDTLTFRTAPGVFHVIALAADETAARAFYPVVTNDGDDPDLAPGSGAPKLVFGPGNFPIQSGIVSFGAMAPNCGLAGQAVCTFTGGNDVESAGGVFGFNVAATPPVPASVDWSIQVNAGPGNYHYFCFIHPGMRGNFTVVPPDRSTTTQAQIDEVSQRQFEKDRRAALRAEAQANQDQQTTDENGVRIHYVKVGISAADNHVAIDEMLPARPLNVQVGDRIVYLWPDTHNAHTVSFPSWSPNFSGLFVPDCSPADPPPLCGDPGPPPEIIAEPGTERPGQLVDPSRVVDSGVLVGTAFGLSPSVQSWPVVAGAAGTYHFQCQIHDWMLGTVNVGTGAPEGSST